MEEVCWLLEKKSERQPSSNQAARVSAATWQRRTPSRNLHHAPLFFFQELL